MGLSPSACGSVMQLGSEGTDLQNTRGVSGQSEGDLVQKQKQFNTVSIKDQIHREHLKRHKKQQNSTEDLGGPPPLDHGACEDPHTTARSGVRD